MQIINNHECMKQYSSVQRTLEQGLAPQVHQAAQPHQSGAVFGSATLERTDVAVTDLSPRSCGSAASRASAPTAVAGSQGQLRYLTATALMCPYLPRLCPHQLLPRYPNCPGHTYSEDFGIIQRVIILVEPCAAENCQLDTKFGCSQCSHLTSAGSEGLCALRAFEENPIPL